MQYYKIILENTIIGVITSNNFIYYSPVAQCYLRCDETKGEYVSYKGNLYRTTWMWPMTHQENYIQAQIIRIDNQEYITLKEAFETKETIEVEEEEEEQVLPVTPTFIPPEDEATIEFIRESKIQEMSSLCKKTIEQGIDLELRGTTHHFSLSTQDQLNLISLSAMAQTQELIPYHADGEMCIFYTNEEINSIIAAATSFKIYHTTYYNALKAYINALDTIEEISKIEYGTPIPEQYKSDVLKTLES